jgi:integrase
MANPCANAYQPAPVRARDRVLNKDEIRWFCLACDGINEPFKLIFRLLLLTGQRLNEVAGMRRTELRDNGEWHLPGERTKNRRAHVVPLPPSAQSIIIAAMPVGENQFVFTTSAGKPPVNWSKAKAELDAAMLAVAQKERGCDATIEPWRLHDLRRTAVTGMAELKVPVDVIELTVNHAGGSRGGIAGTYNRSELLDERRTALERKAAINSGAHSISS